MVTFQDIEAARGRIAGAVYDSPCPPSIPLSEITGIEIFCKLDNLQRTGSFKERGARNALAQLSVEQQKRGVIAASAGNHGPAPASGLFSAAAVLELLTWHRGITRFLRVSERDRACLLGLCHQPEKLRPCFVTPGVRPGRLNSSTRWFALTEAKLQPPCQPSNTYAGENIPSGDNTVSE